MCVNIQTKVVVKKKAIKHFSRVYAFWKHRRYKIIFARAFIHIYTYWMIKGYAPLKNTRIHFCCARAWMCHIPHINYAKLKRKLKYTRQFSWCVIFFSSCSYTLLLLLWCASYRPMCSESMIINQTIVNFIAHI